MLAIANTGDNTIEVVTGITPAYRLTTEPKTHSQEQNHCLRRRILSKHTSQSEITYASHLPSYSGFTLLFPPRFQPELRVDSLQTLAIIEGSEDCDSSSLEGATGQVPSAPDIPSPSRARSVSLPGTSLVFSRELNRFQEGLHRLGMPSATRQVSLNTRHLSAKTPLHPTVPERILDTLVSPSYTVQVWYFTLFVNTLTTDN